MQAAGQHPNPDLVFESTKDTPHQMLSLDVPFEPWKRSRAHRPRARGADARGRGRRGRDAGAAAQRADGLLRPAGGRGGGGARAVDAWRWRTRVREVAQARFDEGAAPRLDVMEADLGLARAKADLELARSARRSAQAELNALLNRPAAQPLAVAGDLAEGAPLPSLEQATARAAAGNAELRRRRARGRDRGSPAGPAQGRAHPDARLLARRGLQRPGRVRRRLPRRPQPRGADLRRATRARSRARWPAATRRACGATRCAGRSRRGSTRRTRAPRRTGRRSRATARRSCPPPRTIESLAEEGYRLGRSPVLAVLDAQRRLRDVKGEYSGVAAVASIGARRPGGCAWWTDRVGPRSPEGSPPRSSSALAASGCTPHGERRGDRLGRGADDHGRDRRRRAARPRRAARRARRDRGAAEPGREARRAGAGPGRRRCAWPRATRCARGRWWRRSRRRRSRTSSARRGRRSRQAKAALENARLNLARTERLFERGIAAGKEVEDARAQARLGRGRLSSRPQAALATADRQLGARARPLADLGPGGEALRRRRRAGGRHAGAAAPRGGERRAGRGGRPRGGRPPGPRARRPAGRGRRPTPGADRTFDGEVVAIAPGVDPATNAALVRIRVKNPERLLKVGMFAQARIGLQEKKGVLVVPPSAVSKGERGRGRLRGVGRRGRRARR